VTAADDKYLDAMRRFSGDLRMVQQVFTSMQQREVTAEEPHYRLLLKAYLDARDLAGARRILDEMRQAGHDVDTGVRWDLAIATGRAGRTDEALAMLDQLHEEGVSPDPAHASQVLGIYLAAGRHPAARAVSARWPSVARPPATPSTRRCCATASTGAPSRTRARSST
jgi:pentatricopeptide repeat protein